MDEHELPQFYFQLHSIHFQMDLVEIDFCNGKGCTGRHLGLFQNSLFVEIVAL